MKLAEAVHLTLSRNSMMHEDPAHSSITICGAGVHPQSRLTPDMPGSAICAPRWKTTFTGASDFAGVLAGQKLCWEGETSWLY